MLLTCHTRLGLLSQLGCKRMRCAVWHPQVDSEPRPAMGGNVAAVAHLASCWWHVATWLGSSPGSTLQLTVCQPAMLRFCWGQHILAPGDHKDTASSNNSCSLNTLCRASNHKWYSNRDWCNYCCFASSHKCRHVGACSNHSRNPTDCAWLWKPAGMLRSQ